MPPWSPASLGVSSACGRVLVVPRDGSNATRVGRDYDPWSIPDADRWRTVEAWTQPFVSRACLAGRRRRTSRSRARWRSGPCSRRSWPRARTARGPRGLRAGRVGPAGLPAPAAACGDRDRRRRHRPARVHHRRARDGRDPVPRDHRRDLLGRPVRADGGGSARGARRRAGLGVPDRRRPLRRGPDRDRLRDPHVLRPGRVDGGLARAPASRPGEAGHGPSRASWRGRRA
jgi:hypothetical protein